MIEKWKHTLDKGKKVHTIFMDLSKAFDTLNHNLLLAKLIAIRFQRVNINNNFSEWCKILLAVPQESILGPLLFYIFINDIFFLIKTLIFANLLMIIHYIPSRIISNKLKLF